MLYTIKERTQTSVRRATRMITTACVASLCVGGAFTMLARPANATASDNVRTRIVSYGDLNIASAQGQEVLHQRIRRAAKQVCDVVGTASILQRRAIRKCAEAAHNEAWAIAEQRIGNYRLAVRVKKQS